MLKIYWTIWVAILIAMASLLVFDSAHAEDYMNKKTTCLNPEEASQFFLDLEKRNFQGALTYFAYNGSVTGTVWVNDNLDKIVTEFLADFKASSLKTNGFL